MLTFGETDTGAKEFDRLSLEMRWEREDSFERYKLLDRQGQDG